jgi:hypothetical protein
VLLSAVVVNMARLQEMAVLAVTVAEVMALPVTLLAAVVVD